MNKYIKSISASLLFAGFTMTAAQAEIVCYDFEGRVGTSTISTVGLSGSVRIGQGITNDSISGTPLSILGGGSVDVSMEALAFDEYDNNAAVVGSILNANFGFGPSATDFIGIELVTSGTNTTEIFAVSYEGGALASSTSLATFSMTGNDSSDPSTFGVDLSLTENGANFDLGYDFTGIGNAVGAPVSGSIALSNANFTSADNFTAVSRSRRYNTTVMATQRDDDGQIIGGVTKETTDHGGGFQALGGEGLISVCNDVVPEPSSALLTLLAGAGFLLRRRR